MTGMEADGLGDGTGGGRLGQGQRGASTAPTARFQPSPPEKGISEKPIAQLSSASRGMGTGTLKVSEDA